MNGILFRILLFGVLLWDWHNISLHSLKEVRFPGETYKMENEG